jgi:hypothetical protein
MRRFAEIFAVAAERKGGVAALEDILAKTAPRPPPEIAAMQDGRIFYAGFSSKVIDDKWGVFEKGFYGHCHVADGRARRFSTSRNLRLPRRPLAMWSSPQYVARGVIELA